MSDSDHGGLGVGDGDDGSRPGYRRLNSRTIKVINCMVQVYRETKAATSGSVVCPGCLKRFVKRDPRQVFCTNKGQNNCKDKFWNFVIEERRLRTYERG